MERETGLTEGAAREELRRAAVLIDSDGAETAVVILDISRGGFRLELEASPRPGEFATLRIEPDQEFPAQIRWVLGRQAGGLFLDPAEQPSPE
jgi:hypothetical protein